MPEEQPTSPLAEALRGRDLAVLLGAGASVEAGVPTAPHLAAELSARMEKTATSWRRHEAKALNFVIGQMRAHASAEGLSPLTGPDVEELFSAVQMLTDREHVELAPFVRAWHPAINSFGGASHTNLTKLINENVMNGGAFDPVGKEVRALVRDETMGSGGSTTYTQLLSSLQSLLCDVLRLPSDRFEYLRPLLRLPSVQIYATLNYDLGLESAANAEAMSIDQGVESWGGGVDWTWTSPGAIKLLKLHGSINWKREQEYDSFDLRPLHVKVTTEPIDDPLIIFGRREKLRAEGPFLAMLAEFERAIAQISALLVVGYSFRDEHINVLLKRWLVADQDRRLAVIDPGFPEHWQQLGWSGGPRPFLASLAWLAQPATDQQGGGPAATQVWVDRRGASAGICALAETLTTLG